MSVLIPCEYRANPRNKRILLSYKQERGFLVTYPPRTSKRKIDLFIKENQEWMQKVLKRAKERNENQIKLRDYLIKNPQLTLHRKIKQIEFVESDWLWKESEEKIYFHPKITDSQLRKALISLSKNPLVQYTYELADKFNLKLKNVTIRDQKSRWGSCSTQSTISLNWRLILMPDETQEHIIIHELAHIHHPNHSWKFWQQVKQWEPDFKIREQTLKKHGAVWIKL